jgi:hypothetical protein
LNDTPPLRLAMWSGPRNISTALMRSWGNRPDTFVCDEPLYAHYLKVTRVPHPGADEVIRCHEADWRKVVAWITGPVPEGKAIFYQKHMAHHLLPHIERDWLGALTHAFLIREPREMLTSLIRVTPDPSLEDTGLPQQVELFDWVQRQTGTVPPVLDAWDVLEDPRGVLSRLCQAVGMPFVEEMLSWPPGRRDTDGVWAKHWYDAVERSTSFQPYTRKPDLVPNHLSELLARCEALYGQLYAHRLRPEGHPHAADVR